MAWPQPDSHTREHEADAADVRASIGGDEAAYSRLIRRHQDTIAAQMWRVTRNPREHEELVHEVFVQAYLSLRSYRGDAPFLHWLRRIARWVGYAHWKKQARERERTAQLEAMPWPLAQHAEDASEAGQMLFQLLATLPAADRMILTMHYFEGYRTEEIAVELGWTQTLVKVRAFRARRKLKAALEQAGYGKEVNP